MRKLSLLLLKSFIGPFIITFVVAMFVLEMQFIWLYMDDLMGKGLSFWTILQLLVFASARIINLALPLAILMSSIMTLGNLAEHYELTSMKSAGISLFRILRPLVVMILLISAGAFFFANNVWPIANLKFRTLLTSIVNQRPAFSLDAGQFYNGIEGVSIRVMSKNDETGEIGDVLIYDHTQYPGNRRVIHAERGSMAQTDDKRFLVLTLNNGTSYDEPLEKGRKRDREHPHIANTFEQQILRIDLASLFFEKVDESLAGKQREMMTVNQLATAVDSLEYRRLRHLDDLERYILNSSKLSTDTVVATPAPSDTDAPILPDYTNYLSPSQKTRSLDIAGKILRSQKTHVENAVVREMAAKRREANQFRIEFHRKFFFAFACIVLFFIGAPLGAIIRKGGIALPAVVALCLFILYYILTISGEKMAKAGNIDPWLGMWFGSLLLIPMAVFLTYKAGTDSAVMDGEVYSRAWNKFVGIFKKSKQPSGARSTTVS